jgi:tRNA pseudouridine38-40 synthase
MRLLAIIEYDGTDFNGFQLQRNKRTVQGELERALHEIAGTKIRVIGAGRTDTGVHASGQGAHFDIDWKKSTEILWRALNAVLPKDISIRSLTEVPPDFSARYYAKSRTYQYTILNQTIRSPLAERYALHVSEPLDADAMNAAAQCLIGEKDFGAFGTPPRGDSTLRVVYRAQVERRDARVIIEIEANAFLYRMVRRIVGTLLRVGKGTLSVSEFPQVIEKKKRAGEAVPPQGLCLIVVNYSGAKDENF